MERDVVRSPSPRNILGVNVLALARGQYSDCLGLAGPIGDADPKQQSTGCYVLLKRFGMVLAIAWAASTPSPPPANPPAAAAAMASASAPPEATTASEPIVAC